MTSQCLLFAITFLAATPLHANGVAGECPARTDAAQSVLVGTWQAELEGSGRAVTLRLAPHPEFAGTVKGTLDREGHTVQVSGDSDDGDVTLEESENGRAISAVWLGEEVEGSCGREIRGRWKAEGSSGESAFVLRKR